MNRRPRIAVINASQAVDPGEVPGVVEALQTQVNDHFMPAWGSGAHLVEVPPDGTPPPGSWWLVILDDSDQAGALGYHDLTAEGLPLGKVFAGSDLQYGYQWTVTCSHELLEILADPDINLTVQIGSQEFVAYEVCDAVEADGYGYSIGDVLVSDFVTPAWFMPGYPGPYDYAGVCSQPLTLLPGGYIGVWRPGGGWTQVSARSDGADLHTTIRTLDHALEEEQHFSVRPRLGSRRERRRTSRRHWRRSVAHADELSMS